MTAARSEVNLWQKRIRADVVRAHLAQTGQSKCVCFSCGNSAAALKGAGLKVIHIGPCGSLEPRHWFTYGQVACTFPGVFDATSGHLPLPMINEIALRMRQERPQYLGNREVLCGSGETLLCLSLAYPEVAFTPTRDNTAATEYHALAPLNGLIARLYGPLAQPHME